MDDSKLSQNAVHFDESPSNFLSSNFGSFTFEDMYRFSFDGTYKWFGTVAFDGMLQWFGTVAFDGMSQWFGTKVSVTAFEEEAVMVSSRLSAMSDRCSASSLAEISSASTISLKGFGDFATLTLDTFISDTHLVILDT